MLNSKFVATLIALAVLACFVTGCSDDKPGHSAGLVTKEEEVASGDWKHRERKKLPKYFEKHLETKLKEIKAIYGENSQNKELFIFFTDYHIEENQGFSPLLVKELDAQLPLSLVAFGGDIYDKGPSAKEAQQKLDTFQKRFEFIKDKLYCVVGNHEFNTSLGNRKAKPEAVFSASKLKQVLPSRPTANEFGDYWIEKNKVRYFFLGTNPKQNLKSAQYTWLFGELEQLPQGITVLLFSHLGCGNAEAKGTLDKAMLPVAQALGALKTGTDFAWNGRIYHYAQKQVKVVGCLSGHVHKDDQTRAYGIDILATARDAVRYDPEKKQVRQPGTIGEQALDVVVLDKLKQRVDLVRVGHGKNRNFTY